jgi:hypothetical protein
LKKQLKEDEKKKEERIKKREEYNQERQKKTLKLGRHKFVEPLPEVQLSEDLSMSLRQLKVSLMRTLVS